MPRVVLALSFAISLPLIAWANARTASRLARALGGELGRLAAELPVPEPARNAEMVDVLSGAGDVIVASDHRAAGHPRRRRTRSSSRKGPILHGVFVSNASVLRIADSGVRPRGEPVAADGVRPAGLLLQGVSALGVGLRDGDVLTSVAGAPARDAGDVVSAVIAARGRRARRISGIFWRRGEPWRLVVEQPYVVHRCR